LPTDVTARARKANLVRPIVAELTGATVIGGPARQQLAQLDGRAAARFGFWHDGTPDRALVTWIVEADAATEVELTARHDRAGSVRTTLALA